MVYEINGRPLEEVILESARESNFDKKTMDRLEELCLPKLKEYTGKEVKQIREELNLSQPVFAKVLGVSDKTVKGWEQGNNVSKIACRLISIIEYQGLSVLRGMAS
jgi:putative transcriptional regulator